MRRSDSVYLVLTGQFQCQLLNGFLLSVFFIPTGQQLLSCLQTSVRDNHKLQQFKKISLEDIRRFHQCNTGYNCEEFFEFLSCYSGVTFTVIAEKFKQFGLVFRMMHGQAYNGAVNGLQDK